MENRVKVGQHRRNWDSIDEEAERQAQAIRAASASRAIPNGKGKKVGHHRNRV
jgi:hypothetical protein